MQVIPTTHTQPLQGKCFDYQLRVQGTNVIYTGDTATLEPFTPLLQKGSYIYTEVATFQSDIHPYIDDILLTLEQLTQHGIDENTVIKRIDGTIIRLAQFYEK